MIAIAPDPELPEAAVAEFARRAERTPEEVRELIQLQHKKILELKDKLRDETKRANRAEFELQAATNRLSREGLTAIQVLRRMYQGVDAFDQARFKCAVEALEFESPRLVRKEIDQHITSYATKLELARRISEQDELERRQKQLSLKVINGRSGGIAPDTAKAQCAAPDTDDSGGSLAPIAG